MVKSLYQLLLHRQSFEDEGIEVPEDEAALRSRLSAALSADLAKFQLRNDKDTRLNLKLSKFAGQPPPIGFLLAFSELYRLQVWVHYGTLPPVVHTVEDSLPRVPSAVSGGNPFQPGAGDQEVQS